MSSKGFCSLDNEDSEVGDDGKDESLGVVIVDGVIVSARRRGTKRPWILGCVLHASVEKRWLSELKKHDVDAMQRRHVNTEAQEQ